MEADPLELTFAIFWVRNTLLLLWAPCELLIPLKQREQKEANEIFVNQYSSKRFLRTDFSPPHHKLEGYLVPSLIKTPCFL